MTRVLTLYKNAFGGLSRAAWILALVMLINRSGSMVVPFLSVYLTASLGFDLEQAGILLSLFGVGSITGAFVGGWLTDKIGHFWVQFFSLVGGGSLFFFVANLADFLPLCVGIFTISAVSEMLRPANSSSVAHYAKPENVTRAFSLNRMAINLGYSFGPAVGGILATFSYNLLFIVDGITCISAGILFFFYFKNKKGHEQKEDETKATSSPLNALKDWRFVLFVLLVLSFATVFFQLFMTLPLYYKDVYQLPESQIGLLIGLNGFIVFLLEMIIVYSVGERFSIRRLVMIGSLLNGLAFIILNLLHSEPILYLAVLIISVAEIMAMPFMATYTVQRSGPKNRGIYMGMYSFAYSAAFVLAPALGTNIVRAFDFTTLWWVCGVLSIGTSVGFFLLLAPQKKKA
ncbi:MULTISPECIES: MFS transporter [unclassified Imperialibacter]|uniref:MDR family MFS transporter n=1 Tax=unclassified Imperialibacter TaxID=2629706 RepID=UPI001258212B|nr:MULTISPECIES: MFS transporter [unclassified Imperialibacter]CAD5266534.1 MFS transporter [Imperialibacter sp. 89]CAD5281598.1 MFS transporter [Imperialibacter sp. 75]VVT16784.1 Predicted arabinose efflux permease, MFS family [Imperialibacter sp. EC-SDR9]